MSEIVYPRDCAPWADCHGPLRCSRLVVLAGGIEAAARESGLSAVTLCRYSQPAGCWPGYPSWLRTLDRLCLQVHGVSTLGWLARERPLFDRFMIEDLDLPDEAVAAAAPATTLRRWRRGFLLPARWRGLDRLAQRAGVDSWAACLFDPGWGWDVVPCPRGALCALLQALASGRQIR